MSYIELFLCLTVGGVGCNLPPRMYENASRRTSSSGTDAGEAAVINARLAFGGFVST